MPYRITITHEAQEQLRALRAYDQRIVEAGILAHLPDQPTASSKAIKALRPNPLATYELRLGDFRVLYNVEEDEAEVAIVIVGRKVGNTLIVGGEEFHGHEGHSPG